MIQRHHDDVADRVEQILVFIVERVGLARRQPDGALHTRALPDGADDLRPLGFILRIRGGRAGVANQVSCHFELT